MDQLMSTADRPSLKLPEPGLKWRNAPQSWHQGSTDITTLPLRRLFFLGTNSSPLDQPPWPGAWGQTAHKAPRVRP